MSKTQIDRLGDRLPKGDISEADLRLLDSYRRVFGEAYEEVVGQIRDQLGLEPTGRPAKSTTSIIDKLQRESIRLSQMQDIAGCRLTVSDIFTQDEIVAQVKALFNNSVVIDRRVQPSHDYRAVHVVVNYSGKLVEVQVRTSLQHLWAELSEKLSDIVDNAIKYGGGDKDVRSLLTTMAERISNLETAEGRLLQAVSTAVDKLGKLPSEIDKEVIKVQEVTRLTKQNIVELLNKISEVVPREKGEKR